MEDNYKKVKAELPINIGFRVRQGIASVENNKIHIQEIKRQYNPFESTAQEGKSVYLVLYDLKLDIPSIEKFCSEFGLLTVDTIDNVSENLQDFIEAAENYKFTLTLYRSIKRKDTQEIIRLCIKYLNINLENMLSPEITNYATGAVLGNINKHTEKCRMVLPLMRRDKKDRILSRSFDNEWPNEITLQFDRLIDACYGMLAFYITDKAEYGIEFCKKCGKPFIKQDIRQIYCRDEYGGNSCLNSEKQRINRRKTKFMNAINKGYTVEEAKKKITDVDYEIIKKWEKELEV